MYLIKRIHRILVNVKHSTYRLFCVIIVSLSALFGVTQSANAETLYVDGSLTPCGNGTGWSTAYRYLQDALDFAADPENNITQIWVKGSETYYPDENCANTGGTGDWNDTFNMINGVVILGGFDGTELDAEDRDPVANVTILSGDLDTGCGTGDCHLIHAPGCDDSFCCDLVCEVEPHCCTVEWDVICLIQAGNLCSHFDHSFNVVSATDVGATSILDGFTVTGGRAWDLSPPLGAGLSILDSSPTIVRCKFTDNSGSSGGGVTITATSAQDPSEPIFANCQFIENLSYCYGGGMLVSANSSVTVVNSVFYLNDLQGQYQGAGFATLTTTFSLSI